MPDIIKHEIDVIIDTLLAVGERVIAVSSNHIVTGIWERKGMRVTEDCIGKKLTDLRADLVVSQCDALVASCFNHRKNDYLECSIDTAHGQAVYAVRALMIHPDKDHLFLVIERLSARDPAEVMEDKWKLALDAAGDGMWDIDMQTGKMFLSGRWQDIFGYDTSEIKTAADWAAKIHPDDLPVAIERREAYRSGKTSSYSAEVRYLCKDGSYKWILSRGVALSRTSDGQLSRFIGTHTDINERKLAEEQYFSVAQLLSTLVDNIDSSIVVTDEHRKIVFANRNFCKMYSIKASPASLSGMDVAASMNLNKYFYKDPEKFIARTEEILAAREKVMNEECEFADGRVFVRDYIPLSLGPEHNGEIWQLRDVTVQKNTEKRIEAVRHFYENILHNIPADIAVFDEKHTYLFVNRHAFKNEELRTYMIGKTDVEYAQYSNRPYSFVEQRFALYDAARDGKKRTEIIEKLTNKQGKEEYHLRILNPVFFENGELEFLMAYGLNVTDLIVAQQALKISADTFSSAFGFSGIGMALISPGGAWLDVNDVLCRLTGYSKEELLKLSYHDITFPDDDEIDRPFISRMLTREIDKYTIEKRYVSKDKKIILVSLTVSLVWYPDGTPNFFIAQVVDITEKKQMEDEIKRKNQALEDSKMSLINKVEQLEELSHIIAHNLRGPAGNIKMLSEAIIERNNDAASGSIVGKSFSQEQAIQFIQESSTSLINSLATLMEITEIKLNKEIPYDHCNVAEIIKEVSMQLLSVIYERSAVITPVLEVEEVYYPKAYLENIIYNFISNALKYCKKGVPPEITITVWKEAGRVKISVKDNGLGINIKKYGSKLFKLNQVFHKGYDSKGVGLYITKTQVESLGGTIDVISEENEGSDFIVTL